MQSEFVVGLDMGTTKTSVLIGECAPEGRLKIIGAGSAPSEGIKKGVIINLDRAAECVRGAIHEAERMAGVEVRGVCAGVSGPHMRSFNSRGVIAVPSARREVSARDVEKVIEAARSITLPFDREIVHTLPQDYVVDNHGGIRDPIGMSGMRLEAEVHIVTALGMPLENQVKVLRKAGIDIVELVFEPVAVSRAVLTREEMDLGCLLIDVGGGITNYALFQGGCIRTSGVVAAGGANVTGDLSIGLRASAPVAERLKLEHGIALQSLVDGEETIEVAGLGERPGKGIRKQIVAAIIEPRCEEIFTMVKKAVSADPFYRLLGAGIVLTGGGARLRGMDGVAEEVFDLPVRSARASGLEGLSELAADESWVTCIGLVRYARERCIARGGESGAVGRIKFVIERLRRVAGLFSL